MSGHDGATDIAEGTSGGPFGQRVVRKEDGREAASSRLELKANNRTSVSNTVSLMRPTRS